MRTPGSGWWLGVGSIVMLLAAACGGSEPAPTTGPTANTSATTTVAVGTSSTSSTATGPDLVYVDVDGVESTIADTSRIVTLSGDLTEFAYELGFGDSVVATDITTVEPPEAVTLPKVGVGRFLNAEAVLRYEPTLVLADTQTSPPTAIEQIRSAGVPVVVLAVPTTFDGLYDKIAQIGIVLGVPAEADGLAARIEGEINAALDAAAVSPAPRVAYLYTRGPDVMLLFGGGMTTTALIRGAGGIDAGADVGIEGTVDVTPEALVTAQPDVIIVPTEGLTAFGGLDAFLATPGVAQTPAGIAGRVLDYPEGDFLTFGPRVAASLQALVADLAAGA